jgi:hypothetical protein
MKTLSTIFYGVAIFSTLILTSCKKEGCTDSNAKNFDDEAKKDCDCCTYEGDVVIWHDETVATALVSSGVTALTYYVDGIIVGSSASSTFWTGAPTCGQNSSVTITKDLGIAKNNSYSYSVKDQNGNELWTGVLNFTANTCFQLQLVF